MVDWIERDYEALGVVESLWPDGACPLILYASDVKNALIHKFGHKHIILVSQATHLSLTDGIRRVVVQSTRDELLNEPYAAYAGCLELLKCVPGIAVPDDLVIIQCRVIAHESLVITVEGGVT